jgi:hypothetical protein
MDLTMLSKETQATIEQIQKRLKSKTEYLSRKK